jgi:hypothetical protein
VVTYPQFQKAKKLHKGVQRKAHHRFRVNVLRLNAEVLCLYINSEI